MPVEIRGSINYVGSPDHTAKIFRPILKEELQNVIRFWHKDMLPNHFTTTAVNRYGYQKRSKKYMIRKARKFGHQRALVFSGEMERQVTRMIRVSGSSKRARGRLSGPRYLFAYRKDVGQPDKAADLTAVTQEEVLTMAKFLDQKMTKRLQDAPRKKRRRVK